MYIPYDAIRNLCDPSVRIRPEIRAARTRPVDEDEDLPQQDESELEVEEEAPKAAEVVSLDSFRK